MSKENIKPAWDTAAANALLASLQSSPFREQRPYSSQSETASGSRERSFSNAPAPVLSYLDQFRLQRLPQPNHRTHDQTNPSTTGMSPSVQYLRALLDKTPASAESLPRPHELEANPPIEALITTKSVSAAHLRKHQAHDGVILTDEEAVTNSDGIVATKEAMDLTKSLKRQRKQERKNEKRRSAAVQQAIADASKRRYTSDSELEIPIKQIPRVVIDEDALESDHQEVKSKILKLPLPRPVPHSNGNTTDTGSAGQKKPLVKKTHNKKTLPNVDKNQAANISFQRAPVSDSEMLRPAINQRSISHNEIQVETMPAFLQRKATHDLAFRAKLLESFPEDAAFISRMVPFQDHNISPASIHIFIDFSNIALGYMSYNQSPSKKNYKSLGADVRQLNLSLESLVFLLERGRPIARRVLAGSWPWLPAFDVANWIGYEPIILDKVLKDRTMSQHQKRLMYGDMKAGLATESPQTAVSDGETGAARKDPGIMIPSRVVPQPAQKTPSRSPEKWVEQGVDEILQMKMLETLLDTAVPSTIVLATGDGAPAEYSAGFPRVIERALVRGWTVELVSWRAGLNSVYRNVQWRSQWAPGQFKLIELDNFASFMGELSRTRG